MAKRVKVIERSHMVGTIAGTFNIRTGKLTWKKTPEDVEDKLIEEKGNKDAEKFFVQVINK
tara:strand:- start:1054 stop:1236 length:183 start_codon:yes stop_codon:yes gene_type:complete